MNMGRLSGVLLVGGGVVVCLLGAAVTLPRVGSGSVHDPGVAEEGLHHRHRTMA